eukprot:466784-Pleurochrysis_carterae.AAC.1
MQMQVPARPRAHASPEATSKLSPKCKPSLGASAGVSASPSGSAVAMRADIEVGTSGKRGCSPE